MVAVPAATPPTTPLEFTVATAALLLLHTPPDVASLSVVVRPEQTVSVPVMDAGVGVSTTAVVPADGQELAPFAVIVTL